MAPRFRGETDPIIAKLLEEAGVEIDPLRIIPLDQFYLPGALPFLELPLTRAAAAIASCASN